MFFRIASVIAATSVAAVTVWPKPPPPAAVKPVVNDYYGTRLVDPYQYFENLKSPVVQRFFRQQADYTNAVLAALGPGRETLRRDITRLADAGTADSVVAIADGRIFYYERPPGVNDARLMVRSPDGASHLLLDPDAYGRETGLKAHLSISQVVPSPDGSHVAVSLVPGGDEPATHTRIVETATARILTEDLPRTWFGVSSWSPDGTSVFYTQLPELKPGESLNDRELRGISFRHTLGSTAPDAPTFGIGIDPNVPLAPTDFPFVQLSPVSSYAFGIVAHGVQNEQTIYVAPRDAVMGSGPVPWRKIADVDDAITGFDIKGSSIYLLSHKGASRYKVLALDLSGPGGTAASAKEIVPASDIVIKNVAVASDGLYVTGLLGGLGNVRKLPFNADGSTGPITDVRLPFDGTLGFVTDSQSPGAVFELESWIKPLQIYALDASGTATNTGIRKPPNIDTTAYTSVEVTAPSADGTLVPLSIIMRRDAKLDGSNPTYLVGYGSYGLDYDPFFLGDSLAWLDQGGVYAVVHARGGGEFGEDWHVAGKGPTKQHTIDDAIGAARYLIARKYTSPAHLAIEGTSAGGILIGGAITQHPELFAGALDVVGWTDELRVEAADPNGATNVPEFGSVKTREGFKALYTMDAYQHIVKGRKYPAVMAVTGINDPRVAPWNPAKFAARLQAASASGRPVLLRVDYDAGHGLLAASRAQTIALRTDEFSFLLWQCGSPLFAGIPTHIVRR
jgi:prolyl oligopeptidase